MFAAAVSLVTGKILYISDQVAPIFHCRRDAFQDAKFVEFLAPHDVGVFHSSTTPCRLPPWSVCRGAGEGGGPPGLLGAGQLGAGQLGARSPQHRRRPAGGRPPVHAEEKTLFGMSLGEKAFYAFQRGKPFRSLGNLRPPGTKVSEKLGLTRVCRVREVRGAPGRPAGGRDSGRVTVDVLLTLGAAW